MTFDLELSSNLNGHIEVSPDLLHWVNWTNFSGNRAVIHVQDPSATNAIRRYYRAVIP